MKIVAFIFLLSFSLNIQAQTLNEVVDDYIRKNKVPVVEGSADEFVKNHRPFLRVDAKRKTKTLSVPHGAIAVPIPTGDKCTRDKFYSFYAPTDLVCTVYIVQHIQGKDSIVAFDGGVVKKELRTRVDFLANCSDGKRPSLTCYFLYGAVLTIPFLLPTNKEEVRMHSFLTSQPVVGKDIPALLIYVTDASDVNRKELVKRTLADKKSLNLKRESRFYKQLGDYCIVYYKMQKNEK